MQIDINLYVHVSKRLLNLHTLVALNKYTYLTIIHIHTYTHKIIHMHIFIFLTMLIG